MNIISHVKKLAFSFLASLVAIVSISSVASAGTYTCGYYNPLIPGQCLSWMPGLISGAAWCSGDPDANHVNIYTATNYGGFCQSLPTSTWVGPQSGADLTSYGWNNTTSNVQTTLHINSIKVGSGRTITTWNPAPGGTCGQNGMVCHVVSSNTADTSSWNTDALYVQ